jgi:signal transduction histidine kinase
MRTGLEDLLRSPNLDAGMEQTLTDLLEETGRLAAISNDLLLLSRADAGPLAIKRKKVDLRQLIEGCLEDARILAEPRAIAIEAELPATAAIVGDSDKLMRVFINLLDNAVKYNRDSGTIRVWLKLAGASWELHVANSGPAIPSGDAARLFERFYRGEPSALRGYGLGLSIARELTRAHGGELSLVSSDANSTEFCVRLPPS